mmetsp:Transcript_37691/g.46674  ORF Transcript_37691/g.46674 Transcript_37691/m.46674 type:complete len:108 (-) Transcript_37691:91-414(-)
MLRIILTALVVSAASELPLAADDESGALNLLQHKAGAQESALMDVELAMNMSQPGIAFAESAEGRFRCGVIYCANARGNSCCTQRASAVCCGPGARCHNANGLAMCM